MNRRSFLQCAGIALTGIAIQSQLKFLGIQESMKIETYPIGPKMDAAAGILDVSRMTEALKLLYSQEYVAELLKKPSIDRIFYASMKK